MKTALITPCFLEGKDGFGNDRFLRNKRYLDFYQPLKARLNIDNIFFFDNASEPWVIGLLMNPDGKRRGYTVVDDPYTRWWRTIETINECSKKEDFLVRFNQRLYAGPGPEDYPYCWRVLYAIENLIEIGYEKIIHIDSDCFILSDRMMKLIGRTTTGWKAMWCPTYQFPESSLSVLCEDAFPLFKKFVKEKHWPSRVGQKMETTLPYTEIIKDAVGDRYGEKDPPPYQNSDMDFYAQAPLSVELEFGRFK